ncbi:glycosyltransferase (plasmid) [Ensifer adhaerens]|uniref:CgeB family protein n=1 Tax=Ensifer adhaerens TaxID=106592 RepID=UPI001CBB8AAC|nr:glycosyltransferase [Ensifer adhaerens]MBZ7927215.1 glycosyltransferase [Ensifer adhaerens]UAX98244.1 glycosyltransferase [Ensifer adhaerens]UAY05626.1 glycosyltransferase [Ensifer adhaerens]UAY13004.1 glycosyltransferase [Ensifer adhaerens]
MTQTGKIIVLGLSLSSSWGNGHATTFRALLRGVKDAGSYHVQFLERDVPWYGRQRDLLVPDFCDLDFYSSLGELMDRYSHQFIEADAIVIGSYVPDGVKVIDAICALQPCRLCFYDIDTPVTLAKLDRGDEEYIARRQIPCFDVYFSFTGGRTLVRLSDEFGAKRPQALYCAVDLDLYRNTSERQEWDLGYLGTYSGDRQPTLQKLLIEPARKLPDRRFVIAGPGYPDPGAWPSNVEHIEHLPPSAHASFYSRQRFTLNVTRSDMVQAGWSPSVRLFEAAACRTPLITDWWDGIDSLFPPNEAIVIARTCSDVITTLTSTNETERQAISDLAYRCVENDHSGHARARTFIEAIESIEPRGSLAPKHLGQHLPI